MILLNENYWPIGQCKINYNWEGRIVSSIKIPAPTVLFLYGMQKVQNDAPDIQ